MGVGQSGLGNRLATITIRYIGISVYMKSLTKYCFFFFVALLFAVGILDANGHFLFLPLVVANSGTVEATYTPIVATGTATPSPAPTATPTAVGTEVQGIVITDTVWSEINSPYHMTGDIEVSEDVVLRIEPGVEVYGNAYSIKVWGTLYVTGTKDSFVTMNEVYVRISADRIESPAYVSISFAQFEGGQPYGKGPNTDYGSFRLTDSIVRRNDGIYISYPTADCYILRNLFERSNGFSIGTRDSKVYIVNNLFIEQSDYGVIENWVDYGTTPDVIVHHNSFLSSDRTAVLLKRGYRDTALDARYNFWNTVEPSVIERMILDRKDSLEYFSVIPFEPFLLEPHSDTPVLP